MSVLIEGTIIITIWIENTPTISIFVHKSRVAAPPAVPRLQPVRIVANNIEVKLLGCAASAARPHHPNKQKSN